MKYQQNQTKDNQQRNKKKEMINNNNNKNKNRMCVTKLNNLNALLIEIKSKKKMKQ